MHRVSYTLAAAATFLLGATDASSVPKQDDRARFQIVAPSDTSFQFLLGNIGWVRRGQTGTVVDPRQGFQLVAEFTVTAVGDSTATGLVTGMTTSLAMHHVVLLREPRKSFLKQKLFWMGSAIGLVAGFVIGRL